MDVSTNSRTGEKNEYKHVSIRVCDMFGLYMTITKAKQTIMKIKFEMTIPLTGQFNILAKG